MKRENPPINVVFLAGVGTEVERRPATSRPPKQLTLELDPPNDLLVVVSNRLHGATFLHFLMQSRPKLVLDFRFAPHFNFTAVDVMTIKRQIEAVGASYIKCPTPFHEFGASLLRHDPMAIASQLPMHARAHGALEGPFMVMVQEAQAAQAMIPFLLGALEADLGGRWNTEIVGSPKQIEGSASK